VWISLSEGIVSSVDVSTNEIVTSLHVGGIPVGVAVDSNGSAWIAAQRT
jgi:DNA-binding beta-propeller fold protein YncE